MKRILLLLALTAATTTLIAHPGAVDKRGGHVDSKTGKYHTHTLPPRPGRFGGREAGREAAGAMFGASREDAGG